MSDLSDIKRKATELRKAGNVKAALPLYKILWKDNPDALNGAGLLHCLRKNGLMRDALKFANEMIIKFPNFNWCRNEVIWTYISGELLKYDIKEPLEKIVQIANKIFELKPEYLATKIVVFKVLKSAKESNSWDIINEWVVKIDPNSLNVEPSTDRSGKKGWADQAIWYNYRINGLIKTNKNNEAVQLVDDICDRFPKQQKFFIRLKALAFSNLKDLDKAENIYKSLCMAEKPDWWLLHEYANILKKKDEKEKALMMMIKASNSNKKLEPMVTLFSDIGELCLELKFEKESIHHFLLCKYIRESKDWSIPSLLMKRINELNKQAPEINKPKNIKEALSLCQNFWKNKLESESTSEIKVLDGRKVRKGLKGNIQILEDDRPFCFIISEKGEDFFCLKSNLPHRPEDGDKVIFDAIPSYDKKKKRKSWRASNIRIGS